MSTTIQDFMKAGPKTAYDFFRMDTGRFQDVMTDDDYRREWNEVSVKDMAFYNELAEKENERYNLIMYLNKIGK
jgi:hypothetical protein